MLSFILFIKIPSFTNLELKDFLCFFKNDLFALPCQLLTPSQGASSSVRVTDTTLTHLKLWLQTKRMELGLFRAVVAGSVPVRRHALEAVARYQGLNTAQALAAVLGEFRAKNIDFGSEKMMTSLMTMLRAETETSIHEVNIPGLSQDPPPPPPGESPPSSSSLTSLSSSSLISSSSSLLASLPSALSSQRYYSSSSVTASYSSGPQPPASHAAPQPPAYHAAPQPPAYHAAPQPPASNAAPQLLASHAASQPVASNVPPQPLGYPGAQGYQAYPPPPPAATQSPYYHMYNQGN